MQRKPGFPVANCNIKMPDGSMSPEVAGDDEWDPQHRRQQLINFGHSQWGFNNWNWMVTKQDLDFVELINGKYTAGVAAFINVTVKSFDIHRENVGYATSIGITKGSAIHRARKCAVTNALRETLLSFGGSVSTELIELLETNKVEVPPPEPDIQILKPTEPKNLARKEETNGTIAKNIPNVPSVTPIRPPPPTIKNAVNIPPPIAKAHPMPANLPPAANRPPLVQRPPPPPPAPHVRPNNVSFILPVMGGMVPPMYPPPPRIPHAPTMYHNYYEYPWHFYETYDRHHGNVNLNFNMPPKNLVVNSRSPVECKNACRQGPNGPEMDPNYLPQNQGCWIKPTIFYDGFWTEQKVKKWVAEQVEKQFPEDGSKPSSPSSGLEPTAPKS
ncbi:DNA repair and recombination protein RAD52 isoform X1 [Pieris rapae]|uniref:DNA repair and recombination protein RAD52 isoform X1 n=1 Tax=Pieris rapae TaxID=64459 RepID=UPI001E27AB81|nr:DNA repair and recombination protein RAD52 isoform X1 [Pieris rapae]